MKFRVFLNADPPKIAKLWRKQPPHRSLAADVSPNLLELYSYGKPYFDREGLILAEQDDELVGFIHAGFGPNESKTDIDYTAGVHCLLMVDPELDFETVAEPLLLRSEDYIRQRGGKLIYAGPMNPLAPFYCGLYGGSEMPGVLESCGQLLDFYQKHHYEESDRCVVMQRSLDDFKSPVDRKLLKLRRKYHVEYDSSVIAPNWWDACRVAPGDPVRFEIRSNDGGPPCGSVGYWVIEPMTANWGGLSVGLVDMKIDDQFRGRGLGTMLVCESLGQLQMSGISIVEVQTMIQNERAIGLYQKLGFEVVDNGVVLRKAS